ncbi:TPA: hypothetical protein SLG48_000663 [Klebsiella pneumoniae]|nr:hypothetical protein [Klebsiella pneumoniae]
MSDEIETIDKNPKSWAAWKMEAERLQAIIDDMALAAMDSKPVAEVLSNRPGNDTSTIDRELPAGTQLYRHAQPALVVPDGYVMVPREPTDEMIAAAMNCEDVLFNSDDSFCVQFGNIYEAMLAAAPQEGK